MFPPDGMMAKRLANIERLTENLGLPDGYTERIFHWLQGNMPEELDWNETTDTSIIHIHAVEVALFNLGWERPAG